jgi:hypothetical protein
VLGKQQQTAAAVAVTVAVANKFIWREPYKFVYLRAF